MKPQSVTLLFISLLFIAAGVLPGAAPVQGKAQARPASSSADKVVYLTFDDGPSVWTARIFAVLARYNARATFFVIGRQTPAYTGLIREAARAGSTFANHTYNHPSLKGISRATFRREIQATADALGPYAVPCLRPPYGAMDANTRAYAHELGYRIVLWDIDPRDWARPGAEAIATHVLERIKPGKVVLLHDGGGDRAQTLAALELILQRLQAQGYRFEPVCH
jgi:peptidoglycan/xylan/chitin deacetylase (PgdA/CDA1 family)